MNFECQQMVDFRRRSLDSPGECLHLERDVKEQKVTLMADEDLMKMMTDIAEKRHLDPPLPLVC